MIKSKRQYAQTMKQIDLLKNGLTSAALENDQNDIFLIAHVKALKFDLKILEKEQKEYEKLLNGEFEFEKLEDVREAGSILVRARIASGLTQLELANLVGKQEQAIQRYEADEYQGASSRIVAQIADALLAVNVPIAAE